MDNNCHFIGHNVIDDHKTYRYDGVNGLNLTYCNTNWAVLKIHSNPEKYMFGWYRHCAYMSFCVFSAHFVGERIPVDGRNAGHIYRHSFKGKM